MKSCYCIHCGFKNDIKNKLCTNCHKKINEKDRVLIDYLFGEAKDEIKGNIFSGIKNFLKKHLYGVIISITVVGGVIANVVVRNNDYAVDHKPALLIKFESPDMLLERLGDYVKNKDIDGISSLMFEEKYPNLVKNSSHYKDNILIQEIDLFAKNDFVFYYDSFLINGRNDYINYQDLMGDYMDSNNELYYGTSAFVYTYNNSEVIFFDFEYGIIKKDDNYYITNIKYYNDLERFNVYKKYNGDLNKVYEYYHK